MDEKNNSLRAMVLAAGVGSRLAPLTDNVPKPIVNIGGRTIMDHILLLLKKHGISNVISNTHHLADKIHQHFENLDKEAGIEIQFLKEETLSGVAGGIRRCSDFLKGGTACIIMGDALTDVDLTKLYKAHKQAVEENGCLATMGMMEVEDSSQFGVIVTESMLPDSNATANETAKNRVVQFQEKPKAEDALSSWANTGIYFFEPEIYNFIPSEQDAPKYDVAHDLFPRLLEEGKFIQAVKIDKSTYWADLGTPKQYLQSVKDIAEGRVKLDFKPAISEAAKIDGTVALEGFNEIGDNTQVEKNVKIKNCVIWSNVVIKEGSKLENCIIGPDTVIEANTELNDKVLVQDSLKKNLTEA